MRHLLNVLSKLPSSLLLASLVLAASALPVDASAEVKLLTPATFDSTIHDGAWLIEFYSPYCHHCRAFAPTWEKLVDHYGSQAHPGVHLAQVNCAENGDLCNSKGVTGYPQLNMYRNSEYAEMYKGPREWERLKEFIDEHSDYSRGVFAQGAVSKPAAGHGQQSSKTAPNPNGTVKSLDRASLNALLDEGPIFVKFFAPWCGHCKKLAPTWTKLAVHMKDRLNVAEVNCEEHKDICSSHGITGYPTLNLYTGGSGENMHKTEYTGGRRIEQLKDFAEMAIAPSITEVGAEEEYEEYVQRVPNVYLFLYSPGDTKALNDLIVSSRILVGSPKILASTSESLRLRFSLPDSDMRSPVLLSVTDGMSYTYTALFRFSAETPVPNVNADADVLSYWLIRHRLPGALELTQESFQDVMMALHRPLVVIAAIPPSMLSRAEKICRDAARAWHRHSANKDHSVGVRDAVFTWMNADKWSSWLKNMYGISKGNLPAVVISDHQDLLYYDVDAQGNKFDLEIESILNAVANVNAGHVEPKSSENLFERMTRRLNKLLVTLEQGVVAHPYQTGAFVLALIIGVFYMVKRMVKDEFLNTSQYNRLQKADANRLD